MPPQLKPSSLTVCFEKFLDFGLYVFDFGKACACVRVLFFVLRVDNLQVADFLCKIADFWVIPDQRGSIK